MLLKKSYSDYDRFAWFYNQYLGPLFGSRVLPILDKLLLSHIPADGNIFDLCCGTGQLADMLTKRGFHVTGIDGSEEMLRYARENVGDAKFIFGDARFFNSSAVYHGVISTCDSLNHIMSLEQLKLVFQNVYAALIEGGIFVFDLNMEERYKKYEKAPSSILKDGNGCIFKTKYIASEKTSQIDLTLFCREEGSLQCSNLVFFQKCYSETEVRFALEESGFKEIAVYDAEKDFDLAESKGKSFFVALKS